MKIKIESIEKINEGILYKYYRCTNEETGEVRKSESEPYYGDDIINLSNFSETELNAMPIIHGKRYSDEKVVQVETHEYNDETCEDELAAEAWNSAAHNAILYVMF